MNSISKWFSKTFGAEAAARREHERQVVETQATRRAWEDERDDLELKLEFCRNYEDLCDELDGECPIITRRGEHVVAILEPAGLLETRRSGARYRGTSHGLSIPIAGRLSYRPSIHGGQIQQAPEELALIDGEDQQGVFVVTNMRGVYRGNTHTREFRWDKLISVTPALVNGATSSYALLLSTENRQRLSGIHVDGDELIDRVLWRVRFGIALSQDRSDDFISRMESELAEVREAEPPEPESLISGSA